MRSRPTFPSHGAAILLALLLAGAAPAVPTSGAGRPEVMRAGMFNPPYMAPDFSLRGSDGSTVSLARYRGKVVLLAFGYTNCGAVCPTTLATFAQARARLGKAADQVQVVYVTVDPARDDAAHLRHFLGAFDRSFIGATGAPATLAAVQRKYGITALKQGKGADYAMAHTSSVFLIDRAGRLRALMPFGHDASDFAHDVRFLLSH